MQARPGKHTGSVRQAVERTSLFIRILAEVEATIRPHYAKSEIVIERRELDLRRAIGHPGNAALSPINRIVSHFQLRVIPRELSPVIGRKSCLYPAILAEIVDANISVRKVAPVSGRGRRWSSPESVSVSIRCKIDNFRLRVNIHDHIFIPVFISSILDCYNKPCTVGQPLTIPEYIMRIGGTNAKEWFTGFSLGEYHRRPRLFGRKETCILGVGVFSLLVRHVSPIVGQDSRTKFGVHSTVPIEIARLFFNLNPAGSAIRRSFIPYTDKESTFVREPRIPHQPPRRENDASGIDLPTITRLRFKDDSGNRICCPDVVHCVSYREHDGPSIRRKVRRWSFISIISRFNRKPSDFLHLVTDKDELAERAPSPCSLFKKHVIP